MQRLLIQLPKTAALRLLAVVATVLVARAEDAKPVSYYHDIVPVFKRSCTGCHHPGKLKGDFDLTTHAALKKGGKHGVEFKAGDPAGSRLIEEISGEEPSMPKEGDPLSKEEIALITRWVKEGASDDTPSDQLNPFKLTAPPVYPAPSVISALAYSPDGNILAVSGYHEVLLHKPDGSGLIARLVGESTRIESLAFSQDGKLLAVSGGAPALFGEIQIWDVTSHALLHSYKVSADSLYGVAFSPDAKRVSFGGADKSVRILAVDDGKELMKFDNHSDWVFGTLFTVDGKRLLTGSRDRSMKLINPENGQFIDDINKLLENVLCIARNPKEDVVIYGGEQGTARIYKIAENQGRTAANNDVNLVRELERMPGAIHAVAYSLDGAQVALGGIGGEVRVYKTADGARTMTLKGHEGAVFALAYNPAKPQIATGGYEGKIRLFDSAKGDLEKAFIPFPIKETQVAGK
ncbi:MAG: Planctomycete cytochrome [Verrucomicrobiales bacterium]|nr:Planctomycete cytochrome [Verrucomicrobiales bacterium]